MALVIASVSVGPCPTKKSRKSGDIIHVIAKRGLPFELHVPNEKTMKAIENSRQGKGKVFSTPQELFDDLGI